MQLLSKHTDEELMVAVKNGAIEKAAILFDRYHVRIFNYLSRLALNKEVGEDLTQNVFLRMLKYKHTYKEQAKFQSWIYQMARNVFADHYQSMKKNMRSQTPIENLAELLPEHDDARQVEMENHLHLSLQKLNEEQRELLVLTRFQQMKYEEVADIMETTVANIKTKVHRAIHKLREIYFETEAYE